MARLEKEHAAELKRVESRAFKEARESAKEVVRLKEEVESVKAGAERDAAAMEETHRLEMERQRNAANLELKHQEKLHSNKLRHVTKLEGPAQDLHLPT